LRLEEIHAEWMKDCVIDRTELGRDSAEIPKLHARWRRIYDDESLLLLKMVQEYKTLKLEKTEFYLTGPTKESVERGWVHPPRGAPLRSELQLYMDADPDIQKTELRIGLQKQKVQTVESIITNINWRHNVIKNAISDLQWKQGG